jgi:START domain
VAEDVLRGAKGSLSSSGLYYGVSPETLQRHVARADRGFNSKGSHRKGMRDTMSDTLEELRLMRQEMEALRKELHEMQSKIRMGQLDDLDQGATPEGGGGEDPTAMVKRRKREFAQISAEVERWAERALDEGEEEGWAEIKCNKMFQNMNRDGRTRAYLKWMKDSRGHHADPSDDREYPCIKMFSTIDAPLEEVCLYLSQPQYKDEYNDLIDRHKDIEEITSHSKICHGQTPQILFLKPRDFVTFCSHRWLRDGTQVVVNQACKDDTGTVAHNDRSMAFAIRGANFISRHPNDPDKTRICMLAHGNPGRDVPMWAIKTAVNSLVPIEPFKLFHKINQGVLSNREELEQASRRMEETELVSSGGISRRPAGLAQLGYACFWPDGGGVQEGGAAAIRMQQQTKQQQSTDESNVSTLGKPGDFSPATENDDGESSETNPSVPSVQLDQDSRLGDVVGETNPSASESETSDGGVDQHYRHLEESITNLVPAMAES